MSEYIIKKTQMVRINALVKALETVMSKWKGHIIIVETAEGLPLYGYHGDDRSKLPSSNANYAPLAHVIVPGSGRKGATNVVGGSSNDLGFTRNSDGTFSFISSAFDRGQGYNDAWVTKVSVEYAKHVCMTNASKMKAKSLTGGQWQETDETFYQDFEVLT